MTSTKRQRFWQFGQWSVGLYLYNTFNRFYDLVLYTAVIAKWGVVKGGAVMMVLSFFLDLGTMRLYDHFKRDLFGIEELKRLREAEATNWTGKVLRWALRQNDVVVFFVLTLMTNQFVVTAWLRRGAGEFNGMKRRDWTIFLCSFVLGNLYWIAVLSGVIHLVKSVVF
ncbi:MAG: hypothetical protein ABI977_02235 [Acidobacteriota bacterium]